MESGVGGQLQGISLDSFLQMVQMEKSSCTLKVTTEADMGWLFVLKGNLIAAATGAITGMEAACAIISWEDSVIEIENSCDKKEDEIKQPLMNVLMEGLRLRDENRAKPGYKPPTPKTAAPPKPADAKKKEATESESSPKKSKAAPKAAPRRVPAEAPESAKRSVGKLPLIALAVVVIAGCGYLAMTFFGGQSGKSYKKVLAQVETTVSDTEKIARLHSFISANEPGEETQDAQTRIDAIRTRMEKADFADLKRNVQARVAAGDFEKAVSAYQHHLNKYAHSAFKADIRNKIHDLESRMDARDFAQLNDKAGELGADRIDLYLAYLKNHPKGKHREEIEKRIAEMSTEYFIHIEAQILDKDQKEDWEACIALAKKFMDIYPASSRADQLRKLQDIWERKIKEQRIFQTLKRSAAAKGTDYAAASLIYANYLRSYPNSYIKEKVNRELEILRQRMNDQRLDTETKRVLALVSQRADRFIANADGTITDKKTGLMWRTLDGKTVENGCMDYESAKDWVKTLRTGGHADWRLPTPEELAALYKKEPFFPETEPTWFWTSRTNRRYLSGWVTDVEVVTSANSTQWSPESRDSRGCGSVRAVRKAK